MNLEINMLAVLFAGVAGMVWGFLWYSPALFGKPWMKLVGFTEKSLKEAQKKMGPFFLLSFLALLLTAYMLSHVTAMSVEVFGYSPLMAGITSAFFMWLGFVMPVQLIRVVYEREPVQLFAIHTGYQLVTLLTAGVIIGGL